MTVLRTSNLWTKTTLISFQLFIKYNILFFLSRWFIFLNFLFCLFLLPGIFLGIHNYFFSSFIMFLISVAVTAPFSQSLDFLLYLLLHSLPWLSRLPTEKYALIIYLQKNCCCLNKIWYFLAAVNKFLSVFSMCKYVSKKKKKVE